MTDLGAYEVLAGGGVVWRSAGGGTGGGDHGDDHEVLLVHRPRYDDWTFPKGKLDAGETLEECAIREVAEETGLHCEMGAALGDVSYIDHKGRTKLVRYWAMTVLSGGHAVDDEVDELRWVTPGEARRLLTYRHDHGVIDLFEQVVRSG